MNELTPSDGLVAADLPLAPQSGVDRALVIFPKTAGKGVPQILEAQVVAATRV
jgi:hypothetical protein